MGSVLGSVMHVVSHGVGQGVGREVGHEVCLYMSCNVMNDSVSDTDEFLIRSHQTAQSAHCALAQGPAVK